MACGSAPAPNSHLPKYAQSNSSCSCQPTDDPMNVLFMNTTSQAVANALLGLPTDPWQHTAVAGMAWAELPGCSPLNDQLVKGSVYKRFHVRLWDLGNDVLGSAHHEYLLTLGGNPFFHWHGVDSFDAGKDEVCNDYVNLGRSVAQDAIDMGNYRRVPYCRGTAATIS